MRGITSAVNVFRFLGLLDGVSERAAFCSNSINLALGNTDFYRTLFSSISEIGLITSQPGLVSLFTNRDIAIKNAFFIPGDSRNFTYNKAGEVQCQFPHYVNQINAVLETKELNGKVFLVAGGFVGKRYIDTIRRRGGIALDIGAIADHWMRHGLP